MWEEVDPSRFLLFFVVFFLFYTTMRRIAVWVLVLEFRHSLPPNPIPASAAFAGFPREGKMLQFRYITKIKVFHYLRNRWPGFTEVHWLIILEIRGHHDIDDIGPEA